MNHYTSDVSTGNTTTASSSGHQRLSRSCPTVVRTALTTAKRAVRQVEDQNPERDRRAAKKRADEIFERLMRGIEKSRVRHDGFPDIIVGVALGLKCQHETVLKTAAGLFAADLGACFDGQDVGFAVANAKFFQG